MELEQPWGFDIHLSLGQCEVYLGFLVCYILRQKVQIHRNLSFSISKLSSYIVRRPQNLTLLCDRKIQNEVEYFFKFLWPSQNK